MAAARFHRVIAEAFKADGARSRRRRALAEITRIPLQRLHDSGSSLADRRRVRFGGSNHGLSAWVAGQPQHEPVVRSTSSQLPLRLARLRIIASHRFARVEGPFQERLGPLGVGSGRRKHRRRLIRPRRGPRRNEARGFGAGRRRQRRYRLVRPRGGRGEELYGRRGAVYRADDVGSADGDRGVDDDDKQRTMNHGINVLLPPGYGCGVLLPPGCG